MSNASTAKAKEHAINVPLSARHVAAAEPRLSEPRSFPINRTLTAAVKSLEEAREALNVISRALANENVDLRIEPILLTVPQVCEVLGYHKAKVYDLMRRGLLPYVTDSKTGHRRIEYRAVQQLVKRLRGRNFERKAS
jgi:excisionase family DNA binding protein